LDIGVLVSKATYIDLYFYIYIYRNNLISRKYKILVIYTLSSLGVALPWFPLNFNVAQHSSLRVWLKGDISFNYIAMRFTISWMLYLWSKSWQRGIRYRNNKNKNVFGWKNIDSIIFYNKNKNAIFMVKIYFYNNFSYFYIKITKRHANHAFYIFFFSNSKQ